jgi:L-alanine-DL-glutamate epimerase-like enolase superfamily enzyme
VIELRARPVWLKLAAPVRIARGTEAVTELVRVELQLGAVIGDGEGAPTGRYGETGDSALAFLREARAALGGDPWAHDEIFARLPPGEYAARQALDAALHDLRGKLAGLPVRRLLGLPPPAAPTSWTVSLADPDTMAATAATSAAPRLKLKLGGGDGLDVERVRAVRAATTAALQVDVNEAWSLDEALDALPQLAALGVDLCEQPLRAGDEGGAELKRRSPLPIFVDEDCRTLADVAACAERAHGVTIKLAKAGGIREALRMVAAARALGLATMIGCMAESSLGIAAAAHVSGAFDLVDLDGNLHLARDPWHGVALVDGVQLPSRDPGLGVTRLPEDARTRFGEVATYAYRRTVRPHLRRAYLLARQRRREHP